MKTQPATESATDRKTIWVFTPSRTSPEDLEFILVQRQALLRDAVERVRESALTGNKHHQLFVGPRGCGKTHLVTLIVNRVSEDAELTDKLRIAWLNEDETCTSLLELLLKVHSALEKRYPAEYRAEAIEPAYEMKPDAALNFVSRHLLSTLGSRTLLIVTENLDAIFECMKDDGQKQLRSFIQENPQFSFVATAQRLVDDLSDRARPFFGFFQTEHLKPLNVEQAGELLQNIARLRKENGVVEFLATSRGRARVMAIHHLSGGNHRIYIVLAQFITRDSVDALIEPFMKMVDELTPYYQERIRWLPPMQRKIVELLCTAEGTVPVKDIAKKLFASQQTISSQLQDLREKGYLESNQRGRESLYEISEPLMRICIEVKDSQRHQPLRLLVDFLRIWYEDAELKNRLGQMNPASAACAYLKSAIQRNSTEGNLRRRLLYEACRTSFPRKVFSIICDEMIEGVENTPEEFLLAIQSMGEGRQTEAIHYLGEAIAAETAPARLARLFNTRAGIFSSIGEHGKASDDYKTVIGLSSAPLDQTTKAFINLALNFFEYDKKEKSDSDFKEFIGFKNLTPQGLASVYVLLSFLYLLEGQWNEGLQSLEKCLEICGKLHTSPGGPTVDLVEIIFPIKLDPPSRREKLEKLLQLYSEHNALPVLGESVVQHIGKVFLIGAPFPSEDDLEAWALAWEQAGMDFPDFRLSLRLLRTGVNYVKAGGKDPGILLDLTSTERAILEQAFGLVGKDEAKN